jgi:hypothetical protein
MRWVKYVARMGEMIGAYRFWCGDLRERGHLEYIDLVGRIILK